MQPFCSENYIFHKRTRAETELERVGGSMVQGGKLNQNTITAFTDGKLVTDLVLAGLSTPSAEQEREFAATDTAVTKTVKKVQLRIMVRGTF